MTEEERRNFRLSLAADGWYGCFKTPDGIRREPIVSWQIVSEDPESTLVTLRPGFLVNIADLPLDEMGGYMPLGVFHPEMKPEPEELAWTM